MTSALARTALATVFFGGGVLWSASAAHASLSGHDGAGSGSGNGTHNRNAFIVNSPSFSHDVQHLRTVNAGGNTITPAAFCKRPVRHCKIIQKVVVIDP